MQCQCSNVFIFDDKLNPPLYGEYHVAQISAQRCSSIIRWLFSLALCRWGFALKKKKKTVLSQKKFIIWLEVAIVLSLDLFLWSLVKLCCYELQECRILI